MHAFNLSSNKAPGCCSPRNQFRLPSILFPPSPQLRLSVRQVYFSFFLCFPQRPNRECSWECIYKICHQLPFDPVVCFS
jgi:hypothetical protein